ncbi:MAG: hypothetical protein IJU81_05105 [Bacteroidales bacterium]|nr:hypothetical protein [Bacteroidales bacterium]
MVRFRLSASEAVSVSSIAVTANRNINGVAAISGSGGLSRSYYYRYGGFSVRLVRG